LSPNCQIFYRDFSNLPRKYTMSISTNIYNSGYAERTNHPAEYLTDIRSFNWD
jgi:hypothetical protein